MGLFCGGAVVPVRRRLRLPARERAELFWTFTRALVRADRETMLRVREQALCDRKLWEMIRRAVLDSAGAVTIETLFFLLVFIVGFFGAVELGRGIAIKQALDHGVYRAARYLSLVPDDQATAVAMVREEVSRAILGGDPSLIRITIDMPSTSFSTPFTVRAEYPFQATVPLVPGLSGRTLVAEHGMRVEKYP
jgi:hypothetical protein